MKLSCRLKTVADMCGSGIRTLADVGCDHGWLGISLALEGRADKVLGMDLREGPLSHARSNAAQNGLSCERFETRLSDGLDALKPGEADVIVIAGIGGVLMCRLITRGLEVAKKATRLVLSPQSHIESVRELLTAESFLIMDERMCRESGKYYTVMCVVHSSNVGKSGGSVTDPDEGGSLLPETGKNAYELSDEELFFGPVLIKKGDLLLFEYAREMRDKAKKRLLEINMKSGRPGGGASASGEDDSAGIPTRVLDARPGIEPGAAHEEGYDPAEYFERMLASAGRVLNR